jgi:hypothetical protein
MRLRASPANREFKEKVGAKKKLIAHLVESPEEMPSESFFLTALNSHHNMIFLYRDIPLRHQ